MSGASGRNPGNDAWNAEQEQLCRERFLVQFEERGYSDKFEFLGGRTSNKGKAKLRCKLCGHEFEKFGSFAQQWTNIHCDNCHASLLSETDAPRDGKLAEHIVERYKSGDKVEDISNDWKINRKYVSRVLHDADTDVSSHRDCYFTEVRESAERRKQCERTVRDTANAARRELKEWREAVDSVAAAIGEVEIVITKLDSWMDGEQSWWEDKLENHSPKPAVCSHCGKHFIYFPSRKKHARRNPPMYCSHSCLRKHNNHGNSARNRLKRYGRADEQHDSISLKKLVERDGGICYLCHEPIDWNDSYTDAFGNFICGPKYPTREHVIALVNGGTHTWDNVRLAHHECNCLKAAKSVEELFS